MRLRRWRLFHKSEPLQDYPQLSPVSLLTQQIASFASIIWLILHLVAYDLSAVTRARAYSSATDE